MNAFHSPVLVAENIHKTFYQPSEVTLLRGVSLKVKAGETVAILGRSGEGKSTLLNILGTLETPCRGTIAISGTQVTPFNSNQMRNGAIGFIFQSFHLLEDYTVLDNVLMPARIARESVAKGSPAYTSACQALERVGLSHRMHFASKLLSGGEKQRASIARAVARNPRCIFADEPSGNLDAQNSTIVQDLLLELAHKDQRAVIIVTHDLELAGRCDTRYQLRNGLLEALSENSPLRQ